MVENTGKMPNKNEIIHHVNGKKKDNRFENLELLTKTEHSSFHADDQTAIFAKLVCPCCGDEFIKKRRKTHLVKPNKTTYCSRSCIGKMSGKEYEKFDQVVEVWKE